jgi:hypothetical protein
MYSMIRIQRWESLGSLNDGRQSPDKPEVFPRYAHRLQTRRLDQATVAAGPNVSPSPVFDIEGDQHSF